MSTLANVILCEKHAVPLTLDSQVNEARCSLGCGFAYNEGIVDMLGLDQRMRHSEIEARDRQAKGYMAHSKFPTQVRRFEEFISILPDWLKTYPVLDLGCGPGPTTAMLTDAGFAPLSIDFSRESLMLNAAMRPSSRALYVCCDLNRIELAKHSCGVAVMADFLQHLGSAEAQRILLRKVANALIAEGKFFLSFFNFNLKNRIKRDRVGTFAEGKIGYQRSTAQEMFRLLPPELKVTDVIPMNIFHRPNLDRLAASIPLVSRALSRMLVFIGHKRQSPHRYGAPARIGRAR